MRLSLRQELLALSRRKRQNVALQWYEPLRSASGSSSETVHAHGHQLQHEHTCDSSQRLIYLPALYRSTNLENCLHAHFDVTL